MPNPGSDEPLVKVTLNLYASDVTWLKDNLGPLEGHYQAYIRALVRHQVKRLKERWSNR